MSETETTQTDTPPEAVAPPEAPPVVETAAPLPAALKSRRGLLPVISVLGFLLLAGGEVYLWHLYQTIPQATDTSGQIAALQSQVTALQNAPAAAPAVTAASPSAPAVVAPANAPAPLADSDLADRLGTVSALVNALQTQTATDHAALMTLQASSGDLPKFYAAVTALQTQSAADEAALATVQASTENLTKLTAKMTVLDRLNSAQMALNAGQPLGDIPNAPPALAKFAADSPPTQAALMLGFPAAARAAESASVAGNAKGTYWSAVRARLENLVTISNGSHVIIGAPAAGVIAQAQDLLNAGDLAGAVTILGTLSASTQAAMGGWLTQARDLVAARAAIVTLAGQS